MKLLEVKVSGIAVDREREHPVVLLESDGTEEVLPIWIGPAEATAIYAVLSGSTFERPMTHDLLKLVVEELGGRVAGIEITGIHKDTYFARIILKRDEETFYIDARPSDSIALALRAGAPIKVDEGVFMKYKRNLQLGGIDEAGTEEPGEQGGPETPADPDSPGKHGGPEDMGHAGGSDDPVSDPEGD